jgi:FtsH-binding integral membrane protein
MTVNFWDMRCKGSYEKFIISSLIPNRLPVTVIQKYNLYLSDKRNPMSSGSSRRVALLETIGHYLTAFVVLLKGFDKLSVPGKLPYAMVLIVIGLIIAFGTIFHTKFEKTLKHFKGIIFLLEAVTMVVVGYLYLKDGKELIQYVCFAAAGMFVIAAVVYFTKKRHTVSDH